MSPHFVYPLFVFVNPGGTWRFGQYFAGVFTEAEFASVAFHIELDRAAARQGDRRA